MQISKLASATLMAATLAACGPTDFCSRYIGWQPKGACNLQATQGVTLTQCQTAAKECTSADLAALSAVIDCQDAVPACKVGEEAAYSQAVVACTQRPITLSAACPLAF